MVNEGDLLWTPSPEFSASSNMAKYMDWLRVERGLDFKDYQTLWQWSATEIETFWATIWDYFQVISYKPYLRVLDTRQMPGGKWFEGSQVNYAEHMLRHESAAQTDEIVFHYLSEGAQLATMTWHELGRQVRRLATRLRDLGLKPGDRVVSYMPNVPETAVAMLATVAIGAVWSSAAPEFGVKTVVDRFAQIKPKVFFAADGYRFGGKPFDRLAQVEEIAAALPSLEIVIWLPFLSADAPLPGLTGAMTWKSAMSHADIPRVEFEYFRASYDHPLWVVYSSGTTGLPKAFVHSHVGVLIEHLKLMHFHFGLHPKSVMFFYSTTGWMMWNLVLAALLTGSAAVLYDGNPAYPTPDVLWKMAADTKATSFGASPTYVQIMEKMGLTPGTTHDLSAMESVLLGGSPATPETFDWFYRCVKKDLWVTSQSGGTDLCSGLVGASPTLPVYAGEIQVRMLGQDVQAWNDNGESVIDAVGELVVAKPFPSMPIYFWNDPDNKRYRESYFETFPGVWRHGDFIKINQRGGCYIYGRSDATLNRFGVRIGTAEIYRTVENVAEIADSLVVCCELPGGNFFMPLFVQLKPGFTLDDAIRSKIITALKTDCSPRHVPDEINAVALIPYTLTGKKLEVPVRKIFMGTPLEKAASRDVMKDPSAIDYFVAFAAQSDRLKSASV